MINKACDKIAEEITNKFSEFVVLYTNILNNKDATYEEKDAFEDMRDDLLEIQQGECDSLFRALIEKRHKTSSDNLERSEKDFNNQSAKFKEAEKLYHNAENSYPSKVINFVENFGKIESKHHLSPANQAALKRIEGEFEISGCVVSPTFVPSCILKKIIEKSKDKKKNLEDAKIAFQNAQTSLDEATKNLEEAKLQKAHTGQETTVMQYLESYASIEFDLDSKDVSGSHNNLNEHIEF